MGGSGAIFAMLALELTTVAGIGKESVRSVRSSYEAWMVISWERWDESEDWRECDDCDEMVETSERSDAASPSEEELWPWLSSRLSSGMESVVDCWVVGLVASGRIMIQGGHSFMRFVRRGVSSDASQSFSFFATQGFCVQRSLEK